MPVINYCGGGMKIALSRSAGSDVQHCMAPSFSRASRLTDRKLAFYYTESVVLYGSKSRVECVRHSYIRYYTGSSISYGRPRTYGLFLTC